MINFETKFIAGLKSDFYGLEHNSPNVPLVFFIHGRGGNRQSGQQRCLELSRHGYLVISIDQRNHGDRCFDPSLNEGDSENYIANRVLSHIKW